jgi:hypothetical protein
LLQIAEPFATLFVVIAGILAASWRSTRRPHLRGFAIAFALLIAVLSKETMIVAVPLVAGVALCRQGDKWTIPEMSRRSGTLLLIVALVIGLFALAPILATRSDATAGAYASRFDFGSIGFERLSNTTRATLLPVTRVPWFPANVLFGLVLLAGWAVLFRREPKAATVAAVVLLSFPVGGILLYAAWPGFPGYYATPFALSVGTMLALSLSALTRQRRGLTLGAFGAVLVAGLYGTALAWNGVQADRAIRRTDWAAVQMVTLLPPEARLIVGVPDVENSGAFGRGLSLYAAATAGGLPRPAQDVQCREASVNRAAAGTLGVFLFSNLCGNATASDQQPSSRVVERYMEIDWKTFRRRPVENSVSLWLNQAKGSVLPVGMSI